MLDQAVFALLHVIVFVYWLGGDLGAFYSSHFLTQPGVGADRRLMAAKIVGDVDMAPRTALILMLPTGLMLAQSKNWLQIGWPVVITVAIASLLWLTLAWKLHIAHGGASKWMKALDLVVRWALIVALTGWATASFAGLATLPTFISIKLYLLAGCIALGLYIRVVLKPLGPALMGLTGPDAANAQASLAQTLSRARPVVMGIWILLIAAAFLGLWTPNTL